MNTISIMLNQINKIKRFCELVNHNEGDVIVSNNKYIVDGKSIMGIFSLDLNHPVTVTFKEPITIDIEKIKHL